MFHLRQTALLICLLLAQTTFASSNKPVSDSLQSVLAHTAAPRERVALLLNLKDLNEDTELNLPYSIQLFREAAAIDDTYAMSIAVIPILNRYSPYAEKEDSLRFYIQTLQQKTKNTPEEGLRQFAEMVIAVNRFHDAIGRERSLNVSYAALRWCDSMSARHNDIYFKISTLLVGGYAKMLIARYEQGVKQAHMTQSSLWEEAYRLTQKIPDINIRKNFAYSIYSMLSSAYNQAHRYKDQVALTQNYTRMLDSYYADRRIARRRPYLYADNSYVLPYKQIMRCAINIGRKDLCEQHFSDFRKRMLSAKGDNLLRNKVYLYEVGYLWKGTEGDYEPSIRYCDSLAWLIENGKGYLKTHHNKIRQLYRDHAQLLYLAHRYRESSRVYEKASRIQDSLFLAERSQRALTIRRSHEMDRLKLSETRAVIRNRAAIIISFMAIGLLLMGSGGYLYGVLQRNKKLQTDILRHSRKAQESERMKSTFINTICKGIGPPMEIIDRSVQELLIAASNDPRHQELQTAIRDNTHLLLSTLDNMLEAANLDSLSESLELKDTDIDELCRAEVLSASRLRHNPAVTYITDAPDAPCIVPTHAKYFSFVVRALLDNAGKFTREGSISLSYQIYNNELHISVTDTGCGIPPAKREEIFQPFCAHTAASQGLSLSLCCLIAEHLSGKIRLDEQYTAGARFIFTIPATT